MADRPRADSPAVMPGDGAALLAALERGESRPAAWYTDPAIARLETARVFRRSWTYIAPLAELAAVGDYVTGSVGEIPVVVVRNEGGLAAFVNVCRHRRHEVMRGRGRAKLMQCGYHAWTYDLAGGLRAAPRAGAEPGFRAEDYPLLPLAVDVLGPWVFVNAEAGARPVASELGSVLDAIAGSGIVLDDLELHARTEWRSRSNWKTMLENYLECYHCAVAHPSFSAVVDVRPEHYVLSAGDRVLSQVGPVRASALEGRGRDNPYDVRGEVRQAQYHLLWPNLTININPGFPNLALDVWMPDGPEAARGFSEQYFARGVDARFARDLIAFNAAVSREDDALTDSVQRGLRAGVPERGRLLLASEQLVIRFQTLVARALHGGD